MACPSLPSVLPSRAPSLKFFAVVVHPEPTHARVRRYGYAAEIAAEAGAAAAAAAEALAVREQETRRRAQSSGGDDSPGGGSGGSGAGGGKGKMEKARGKAAAVSAFEGSGNNSVASGASSSTFDSAAPKRYKNTLPHVHPHAIVYDQRLSYVGATFGRRVLLVLLLLPWVPYCA